MKWVVFAIVGVLSFAVWLVVVLAATGNLSPKTFAALMGREVPALLELELPAGEVSGLAEQLRNREATLLSREQDLKREEAQLIQREQGLEAMRKELQDLKKDIDQSLDDREAARRARIRTIALSVSNMKPDKAAQALDGMETQDVAEILVQVKEKDRGKILDALDADQATRVLSAIQDLDISQEGAGS